MKGEKKAENVPTFDIYNMLKKMALIGTDKSIIYKHIDSVIKTIEFSDYNLLNETQWDRDSKELKTHYFCCVEYNMLNVTTGNL